jgi:hypothetical protein
MQDEIQMFDNSEPPDWLLAKLASGEVLWNKGDEGQLLLVRVCRTCQCAQSSCICDAPVTDSIPIWRDGQGMNERLAKYLKGKKEVHAAEKSSPSFKPRTAQEMQRRVTLWTPVKGVPSYHPFAFYMRKLFQPSDRVLIQLIHATETFFVRDDVYFTSRDGVTYRSSNGQTLTVNKDEEKKCYVGAIGVKENLVSPRASTKKQPGTLVKVTDETFAHTLKAKNADGWNVYITMNPIREESKARRKNDIDCIRSVYCEVDDNGEDCLNAILASVKAGEVPDPSIILESSIGKFQFIWFVQDFTILQQEALNKALQVKFKTDPKSVDCSRVLRLPGFFNTKAKYDTKPLVTVYSESPTVAAGVRYSPSDFKIDTEIKSSAPMGVAPPPETIAAIYSVIEEALTKAGIDYSSEETKGNWICHFRFVCPNPLHTTVDRYRTISIRTDGVIGSNCYHSNCDGNDWKSWMRPFLEDAGNEKMHFPKPVEAKTEESKTEKTIEFRAHSEVCLVFEAAEDVALARKLGFNAERSDSAYSKMFDEYSLIVLCGEIVSDKGWDEAARALAKSHPSKYSGGGVEKIKLPADLTAAPEIRWKRKVYPPCQSLTVAALQYSGNQLKDYFENFLSLEAVQKSSTKPAETIETDEENLEFDMTPEEMAIQDAAEYPVRKLKESAGPHFDESILYGPIGEVTKRISEYNESHIAAIYLNLLVSIGNLFGRGPHFHINKSTHYLNESLACVGDSSVARKGQGADEVNSFLSNFAGEWLTRCNSSGFGSGQGIIYQIRDDVTFQTPIKEKGVVMGYKEVTKKGIADKRLCIREDELSGLFKLAARSEDKTDELIRNGWDGKKLSNLVAGKTEVGESNSLVCREPMLSIVGYTTPSLAKTTLVTGADTSGFGNRFLWCHIRRLKLVPLGGPDIEWGYEKITFKSQEMSVPEYFFQMLAQAKKDRLIPLAKNARKFWENLYYKLEKNKRGFVARMTSRGAGHIRRLATILCLIDCEDAVQIKHLEAAKAIWDYCVESARYIFVGVTPEQMQIMRLAKNKQDITRTDVHNLFSRKKTGDWINAQLAGLVAGGYLVPVGEAFRFKRMAEDPK